MAKILAFIIFISVVISSQAYAQTNAATSTPRPFKEAAQNLREEKQDAMAELREERKTQREAFKDKIKEIKDLRKQALTQSIDDKIASANARLTGKMDKALDHMTDILTRVKNKSAAFKAQGENTTALDQAISAAQTAIATAQTAVDAQSEKEYSAEITTDTALRNAIGQMVSGFRLDIQAVHKLVVDAKQAVQKAIMEAAKLRGEEKTATGSANT